MPPHPAPAPLADERAAGPRRPTPTGSRCRPSGHTDIDRRAPAIPLAPVRSPAREFPDTRTSPPERTDTSRALAMPAAKLPPTAPAQAAVATRENRAGTDRTPRD